MKEDKVRHHLMGICGKLQVETLKLDTSLQFYGLHHQYRRKSGSFYDKSETLQLGNAAQDINFQYFDLEYLAFNL